MGCCAEKKTIFVKVGKVGGKIRELCLTEGMDISNVIKMAEIFYTTEDEITVSGSRISNVYAKVLNGDIILIQKKAVLKKISVKVGRVGEPLMSVVPIWSNTVNQALVAAARLPFEDEEVWIHIGGGKQGIKVLDIKSYPVSEGDVVIIEKKDDELRKDIFAVVSDIDSYSDEDATEALISILRRKYNITKK